MQHALLGYITDVFGSSSPVDLLPEKRLWSMSNSCEGRKPPFPDPDALDLVSVIGCDGLNICCCDDGVSLDRNWLNPSSGLGSW